MVFDEPNRNLNDPHGGFFYDLKQRIYHLFGWSLLIDIILKPDYKPPIQIGNSEEYGRREEWVRFDRGKISKMRYVRCEGLKDNLAWWGVPVYCRISGGIVPPAPDKQTATTLNDRMRSNATKEFMRGMWRGSLPSLSIQQIGLLAILGIGAVLGMWWLGVF